MGEGGKIRIAAHVEVEWLATERPGVTCPNCGAVGPVRQLLDIDYRPPGDAHHFILQICPRCTARFPDNPETMDYSSEELIELGWHTYQIQIGAGVWPITAPLTRIGKPPGARMLEIGGAYGFGLDFGLRARGWSGRGYDPSPLAEYGARELGLDIRQSYFGAADLADGSYDVVLATEVVEHLADPPAFFRLMRGAVGQDGVLLLTTPDAACIGPDLTPAQLMPLLSPGAHLVLQTEASLTGALEAAGFAHVLVRREAMSLVAYASPAPFALADDVAEGRAAYRRYLVERAALAAPESDLRLGFAGRGLFEAANDGDAGPAAAAWAALKPAVSARFGLDLEALAALPDAAAGASLAELGRLMPLGLGMILFGRAMQRLAAGEDRAALVPLFRLAVAAVDALQEAMARRSLGDGLSADIKRAAETEILICRAEAGEPDVVPALILLAAERADGIVAAWRGLVGLVNAGAFAQATALQQALGLDQPDRLPGDLRRDALLSLANLALAPGSNPADAFGHAAALEAALEAASETVSEPADDIVLQAFTRLVNAGRYRDAEAAVAAQDIAARTERAAGREAGQDALFARSVLELAVGDPAAMPARLAGLALPPVQREALLLQAFIRLVNASRYEEALAFIGEHDIGILAARAEAELRRDAGLARMVLDLAAGDPAEIPRRLQGLDLEPARREALLLQAFIRLVNASRYQEAQDFISEHDVAALAARAEAEPRRDAGLARMVLDLAAGDPAEIPRRLEGLDLDPARREALLLQAFIRLVNASRYQEALAFVNGHDVPALAARAAGAARNDAGLALLVLDLAVGDPAEVPGRLAGLEIEPRRRQALLLEAYVRLVNASRFAEASTYAAAHEVPALAVRDGGDAGRNAVLALAVADLAAGDPAEVPARLALLPVDPARAEALLFGAFTGLVNAGRPAEAEALAATGLADRFDHEEGEAARDARLAAVLLALERGRTGEAVRRIRAFRPRPDDVPVLDGLYVDAFVRLVNEGAFAEARQLNERDGVARLLPAREPPLRHDGLAALLLLELQPGGDAARVPDLLAAAAAGGVGEARATTLGFAAFTSLVNAGEFRPARALLAVVDPALLRLRPPYEEAARNALFAAGVLALQDGQETRRAAALFARLRDALVKRAPPGEHVALPPDPLFWPALRGEILALQRLDRAAEAGTLLASFLPAYAGAPADLVELAA